jgi:hypothetical protein
MHIVLGKGNETGGCQAPPEGEVEICTYLTPTPPRPYSGYCIRGGGQGGDPMSAIQIAANFKTNIRSDGTSSRRRIDAFYPGGTTKKYLEKRTHNRWNEPIATPVGIIPPLSSMLLASLRVHLVFPRIIVRWRPRVFCGGCEGAGGGRGLSWRDRRS